MKKLFTSLFFLSLFIAGSFAADVEISAGKITNLNWTKDNVYKINGWAYVDSMDVLTIEAGTVIKGYPGEAESSSALIISRGGKIMAEGTKDEPIIFTALADDLAGSVDIKESGLWGSLIMLGFGQNNNPGEKVVEGISTGNEWAFFGMPDKEDEVVDHSAGMLKYVSLRHGGTNIGEGNEINGLTMGACGTGTIVSFVEVISNQDDGIELFGGAPMIDHFLVAYSGDDSYDLDHGTRAYGQFLVTVQDTGSWGECFGEHDGGSGDGEESEFITHTVFSNVTFIGNTSGGNGEKKAFVLRDNWSGEYHNSVFYDAPTGIYLEWRDDKTNSYDRFVAGDIAFANNVFYQVDGTTSDDIWYIVDSQSDNVPIDTATYKKGIVTSTFDGWGNTLDVDPGVSVTNPVPSNATAVASPVYTDLDPWFKTVSYKGAFDPAVTAGHWAGEWTLTFAEATYVEGEGETSTSIAAFKFNEVEATVFPNPVMTTATVNFENAQRENYTFALYNLKGQIVRKIENINASTFTFEKGKLNTGIYSYSLINENRSSRATGKVVVK